MIRSFSWSGVALALLFAVPQPGFAQTAGAKPLVVAKVVPKGKTDPKPTPADDPAAGGAKPFRVGTYGDWGAFETQGGKGKICYALAKPKDRQPGNLTRDPAYVFISTRPGEGVHNEISVIMGFPLKDGAIDGGADINGTKFDLIAKGEDAWVKNAAEEAQVIETMRKGSRLVVKAPSKRGNVTTDSYSLAGFSQALDKVAKSCQ